MDDKQIASLMFDRDLNETGRFSDILDWLYCKKSGSEFRYDSIVHIDDIGERRAEFSLGNIDVFINVANSFRDYQLDKDDWDYGMYKVPAMTKESYINELLISDIKLLKLTCDHWLQGKLGADFDESVKSVLLKYMQDPTYFDFPVIQKSNKRGRPPLEFDEMLKRLKEYWDVLDSEILAINSDGVSEVSKKLKIDTKAFRNSMGYLLGDEWKSIIKDEHHAYHLIIKDVINSY